jgi:hypothetical protein
MRRLSLCAGLLCVLFTSRAVAQQFDMAAPNANVAVAPQQPDVATPPPDMTPQVVEPPPATAPSTVTPEPPVVTPPPDVERPQLPPEERAPVAAPRFAMSADVSFGPAFPISNGVAADERLGQTFRYHVDRRMEGFYVGLTFGQVLDSNAVFLQFANRFGYDLWFRIDDTLSWAVDFYVAIGMFYYAPTPHMGTSDAGFASLELENGLELKLYLSAGFYLMVRPVGLAYLSPGGLGGGATFLDVSGGLGFAF